MAGFRAAGVGEDAARLAAAAAEELRGPIDAVRRNVATARQRDLPAAEQRAALAIAALEAERLHRIVDGLHTLALGDAEDAAPRAPVHIGDVVDAVAFAVSVRHPDVSMGVDTPDATPLVAGDAGALHRAIENLLEHAARRVDGEGIVEIRVEVADGRCTIAIDDDGPAANGTRLGAEDDGLALAIARAEMRRQDARLVLGRSTLGGLSARIELEVCTPAPPRTAVPERHLRVVP